MSAPPDPDGMTAEQLRKIAGRIEWRQLTHEPTLTTPEQDAATLRGWADELDNATVDHESTSRQRVSPNVYRMSLTDEDRES